MRDLPFKLKSSVEIAPRTFDMLFEGDASDFSAPGQFVEIAVPGFFLRRPISVCDYSPTSLRLLVRQLGKGTDALVHATPGTEFKMLTALGNGFSAPSATLPPLLVGGGIGIAPLYGLAKLIAAKTGKAPKTILGFRTEGDAFFVDEFNALGCETILATEDGSTGVKGFVTDAMRGTSPSYVYACGPMPMLKAVAALAPSGQFSLEARMGCGFGACVGCTVDTTDGPRRVCKDGPVFPKEDVKW